MGVSRLFSPRVAWLCRGLSCAVLSIVGCYSPHPQPGAPCTSDELCPTGQACIEGYCGGPPVGVVIDAEGDGDASVPIDAAVDAPPLECVMDTDCTASSSCHTVTCVNNKCVQATRANGASCGTTAAERCCTGTCVNIASDEANCGGCGQRCAAGRTCESVSVTSSCPSAPATTTGRCTCAGANAECPDNQICRTETPFANRCTPNTVTNCAAGQVFVDVDFCPNYCRY